MNPLALDIPERTAELVPWLERVLVSPDLGELIAQLEVYRDRSDEPLAFAALPLPDLLARGMNVLPEAQIRELLASPSTLKELQEAVLLAAAPYWECWLSQTVAPRFVAGSWEHVADKLTLPTWSASPRLNARSPVNARSPADSPQFLLRRRLLTYLATAAASLALGWFGHHHFSRAPHSVWGWNREGVVGISTSREAYLRSLSQAAGEWFQARPSDAASLAQRITEFRAGCSRLLVTEHPALTPDDQQWLREKCEKWATALDEQLATLERDRDTASSLLATDAIVRKLQTALLDRI